MTGWDSDGPGRSCWWPASWLASWRLLVVGAVAVSRVLSPHRETPAAYRGNRPRRLLEERFARDAVDDGDRTWRPDLLRRGR